MVLGVTTILACQVSATPAKPLVIFLSTRHKRPLACQCSSSRSVCVCVCVQAKQHEQAELVQRAERIHKLEARQKQEEEAAVKALSQQLLAHQVTWQLNSTWWKHVQHSTIDCPPYVHAWPGSCGRLADWFNYCSEVSDSAACLAVIDQRRATFLTYPLAVTQICITHCACNGMLLLQS